MPRFGAERKKLVNEQPMHSWIMSWLERDEQEFTRAATRRRERDQVTGGLGLPPEVLRMSEELALERHRRDQFPVGVFLDLIDKPQNGGRKLTGEELMVVAQTGRDLFYAAICAADEDDNREFFVCALGYYGPLVDAALEECGLDRRDQLTGGTEEGECPY